jgi:hypothetical protein
MAKFVEATTILLREMGRVEAATKRITLIGDRTTI